MAEHLLFARRLPKDRIFHQRINNLTRLNNEDFVRRYRLTKDLTQTLVEDLRGDLSKCARSHSVSPEMQVLATLHFLASGSFLTTVGDVHGISKASTCRSIGRVLDSLCSRAKEYISFPTIQEDLLRISQQFYEVAGMPHCIGCIDGTQIEIIAPKGDDEHHYVCRKGYHSLNVQAVCDVKLKFLNVVAKWPGSTHDAFIWNNCSLYDKLQQPGQLHGKGFLLGDSGYPLSKSLLTPLTNCLNRKEERFNRAHKKTRNCIERAFGVMKSRWRAVSSTGGALSYGPEKAAKIILACFILHNICIDNDIPLEEPIEYEEDDQMNVPLGNDSDGRQYRSALINSRF